MGLTATVASLATRRLCCHVVEAPGGASARRALEQELDARGWRTTPMAASADALVVAGLLPEALAEAFDVLWSQLPGPRARAVVDDPQGASHALDLLQHQLRDEDHQRRDAAERDAAPGRPSTGTDHGGTDHGGTDRGDMGMAPGGLPLAEGSEDRDGLEMDVLVHPWGPLLDHWPGGLELRVTLSGDVVVAAEAQVWRPPATAGPWEAGWDGWDALASTLSLVGDDRGAREARAVRDAGAAMNDDDPPVRRSRRRVRRLGRRAVLPSAVARTLLDLTSPEPVPARSAVSPCELVVGHDLADARLLLASHTPLLTLDPPDGDRQAREHRRAADGA